MAVDPQPDQWWLDDPLPSIGSSPFRLHRSRAHARLCSATGRADRRTGTLASLAPLIGEDHLYTHVMTLKADGLDGPRIFRVLRWDLWPVVTAEIKTALEERGVPGVSFQPLHTKR